MPDLQQTRHKMKLALGGMAAASAIAVVVLFSPLVGSTASRREQMDHLWADLKVKNQQVEPLRGMDKKVVTAQGQIEQFYKTRFASKGSEIYDELGKIQAQTGAKIQDVKYKPDDPEQNGLQRVTIDADLSARFSFHLSSISSSAFAVPSIHIFPPNPNLLQL